MKNNNLRALAIISITLVLGLQSCASKKSTTKEEANNLLRICPDEWIQNTMPTVELTTSNEPKEYFIIDGKRREINEFDMEWIRNNCKVSPKVVR